MQMKFFKVFESRVAQVFGSSAAAASPISAKKLAREATAQMEKETYIMQGKEVAPALYTVLVSPSAERSIAPLSKSLSQETALFLEAQAQNKDYVFVGKPLVRFVGDSSLKGSHFFVFAENIAAAALAELREEEEAYQLKHGSRSVSLEQADAKRSKRSARRAQGSRNTNRAEQVVSVPAPLGADLLESRKSVLAAPDPFDAISTDAPDELMPQPVEAPKRAPRRRAAHIRPDDAALFESQKAQNFLDVAPATPQNPALHNQVADVVHAATPLVQGRHMRSNASIAATQDPPTVRARTAPRALLVDHASGQTYPCEGSAIILGRENARGAVVLQDSNISRRHARITHEQGGWYIEDLASTNGTLLNDQEIGKAPLYDQDLITVGLTNLEFREL